MMGACSQCGKRAMFSTPTGILLCLDCNDKYQNQLERRVNALIDEQNAAAQAMNAVTGMSLVPMRPRLQAQPPRVTNVNAPIIRIDRSIVGAVNTGQIDKLEVNLSRVSQGGGKELSQLAKTFTEAALQEKALDEKTKAELVEQITYLMESANAPKEKRSPGVIRSVLETVGKVVSVSGGLAKLWGQLNGALGHLT